MTCRKKRRACRISLAAAAVSSAIFVRRADAVTLNQYYYDVSVYSDSALTNLVSSIVINQSNPVVNVPIGDYLSFGISDVLTNNPNPAAGDTSGTNGHTAAQPAYLGIAELGYSMLSSDRAAAYLAPNLEAGIRGTFASGQVAYYSTAQVQPTVVMPATDPGDIEPGSSTGGDVGINFLIFAGALPELSSGSAKGISILTAFTPPSGNTASFANSTPLFDALSYQGVKDGTITLAPQPYLYAYWMNTGIGSGSNPSTYQQVSFGSEPGDTIVPLPALTVNVFGVIPPTHPIISLTATSQSSNYGIMPVNDGDGVVQNNLYQHPASGVYEILGLAPTPQTEELFGLEMNVTGSDLAALVADINSTNIYGFGSAIASTSLANDPFPSTFNLFLTFSDSQLPAGMDGTDFLTFDFTQDPNVSGATASAIAVAVVPEPMTFGPAVLGVVGGLLLRRRDRANLRLP
jgi:hypothetical protein